ncbi:DUF4124 domain-containing protein [Steroidobacter cummioxidans]|uniref:DUF4124 domain-containing protein n=1 Tax=Steroidobacter cummioxidans TaxID=1803913 RepID=UPI000E30C38E|nr:DUF4124 domain-containing protein [Steroidobacter cummioxidans]
MRIAALVFGSLLLSPPCGAQTTIYRCTGDTGPVYSDRPCAAHADTHEIDDSRVTVYTPEAAEGRSPATTKPTKAKRSKATRLPDPAKRQITCAKLDQSLRDVRTKMRTGYSAKEGERLKARQRQLDQRRRLEKCG